MISDSANKPFQGLVCFPNVVSSLIMQRSFTHFTCLFLLLFSPLVNKMFSHLLSDYSWVLIQPFNMINDLTVGTSGRMWFIIHCCHYFSQKLSSLPVYFAHHSLWIKNLGILHLGKGTSAVGNCYCLQSSITEVKFQSCLPSAFLRGAPNQWASLGKGVQPVGQPNKGRLINGLVLERESGQRTSFGKGVWLMGQPRKGSLARASLDCAANLQELQFGSSYCLLVVIVLFHDHTFLVTVVTLYQSTRLCGMLL